MADEQQRVAGDRGRDLGGAHRPWRRQAPGRVPGSRPGEEPREHGDGEGEYVGQPPPPGGPRRAQVPRGNDLPATVGPRPPEAEPRPRARVLEPGVERDAPAGEGDRGDRAQRVALGFQDGVPVEGHRGAAAALHPQLVPARVGHAQLARPPQRHAAADRERAQLAPGDVDRRRLGGADRARRRGHRGRQAGGPPQRDRDREGDERSDEAQQDAPPGAGATFAAGQRGQDGEPERGPRQREGANVERRLRVDRGPARGGERHEREGDREAEAAGEGEEAHQARILRPLTRLPAGDHNERRSRKPRKERQR